MVARTISDTVTEICALRHGIENAAWEEARGKLMAYLRLRGSCFGGNQEEYDALKYEIENFIKRIDEYDIYSPDPDEITRLREENARLRAALTGLNTAIDDFWNDKTLPSIAHMNEQTVLTVAKAQRDAVAAIRDEKGAKNDDDNTTN